MTTFGTTTGGGSPPSTQLKEEVKTANEIINRIYSITNEKTRAIRLVEIARRNELNCQKKKEIFIVRLVCLSVLPFILFIPALYIVEGPIELLGIYDKVNDTFADIIFTIVGCVSIALAFGASAGILFWMEKDRKSKLKLYQGEVTKLESLIEEKENELNLLTQHHERDLEIIPPQYRYPLATNYIEELFENGRASTLPEAFDKFEEQLHRWHLEEKMQHNLEIQLAQTALLHEIWRWI